ncbi:hypothetical protein F511_14777 [Dorcoceras hygrometricum]|uniref:Uncharacterized protein n=1 Tax=Dorcoceras hygrometricum TaxID=472368 RepID=A0A2Z7C1Z8_9LAMI|nr:hypothetical protein F511_14777 [Dorcoceras hygrometricum]
MDKAMAIEGLQKRRSRVRPQVVQGNRPMVPGVQPSQSLQSSQPPQQQTTQQSGRHRFRPRGHQFKKKSGSSSSGLGSSRSISPRVEFCGSVEESTLRRSVLGCRVSAITADSLETLRECVLWKDNSTPLPHLRVIQEDLLGVILFLFSSREWGTRSIGRSSSMILRVLDSLPSLISQEPSMPRPLSHHSSVVSRHNQSVGHHSDDSVVPFRHDTSVCRSQRGSISGSQSIKGTICTTASISQTASSLVMAHNRRNCPGAKSVKEISYLSSQLHFSSLIPTVKTHIWLYLAKQLLTARTKLKTARNTYPEAHTHRRTLYSTVTKTHQLTASSRSLSNVEPGFLTGINRKSYSRRAQRHQSRSKQRRKSTAIYRRRVRMKSNYRGFTGENNEEYRVQNTLSVEQHLVSKRITNSTANDVAPTNQNDVVELLSLKQISR